jgi:hypothetical protein
MLDKVGARFKISEEIMKRQKHVFVSGFTSSI